MSILNHSLYRLLIKLIISNLNPNKSGHPKSIPRNILKPLNDKVSSYPSEIYNISFSMGVFPSVLKAAKVLVYSKIKQ